MQRRQIPDRLNLSLSYLMAGLVLFQLLVLPLLLPSYPIIMGIIVAALIPCNTPLWSLIHEAVHRNLHSRSGLNEGLARLMSVMFGASFDVLRFGHLMHHQYNREWESEFYDPEKQSRIGVTLNHYFKMLGGLYLIEVFMSFLIAIAPPYFARKIARASFPGERHYQAVLNSVLKPKTVSRLRIDCAAVILLYTASFFLFGQNWPILLFLMAGRAVIISLMDNAYHYGTPADNSVIAKELQVPPLYARFILNFNHHLTHHQNTGLPWTELAEEHKARGNSYVDTLGKAMLVQFRGPRTDKNARHLDTQPCE